MDRFATAEFPVYLPDEVDQGRVHPGRLVAAPIAQMPVDLLQRGRDEPAFAFEGDLQGCLGVNIVEGDRARFCGGEGDITREYNGQSGTDATCGDDPTSPPGACPPASA